MKSWKTSLGAILATFAIGMRNDPVLAKYADAVNGLGLLIMGFAARDNNVTSEQLGLKKPTASEPPPQEPSK